MSFWKGSKLEERLSKLNIFLKHPLNQSEGVILNWIILYTLKKINMTPPPKN